MGGIKGCNGDITAVDNVQAFFEGVNSPYSIVAPAFLLT